MRSARWVAVALVASGCAGISKERGHAEVAALVEERIGYKTAWNQGAPEDSAVAARVAQLLEKGLTRDAAIEIALVNNPSLQETYEELGVSQAEMVQAGLLRNPSLGVDVGLPIGEGHVEANFSLVQEFLDLFMLPLRKRIAAEQFEADTARVAHEALQVAAEVSQALAAVQANEQLVELRRTVVEAAQASTELAERQYQAGNINELELATERAAYQQGRLELAADELALQEARERLNRLLGLWGPQAGWTLAQKLPELPAAEAPIENVESLAIRQRLDIQAAKTSAGLMSKAVDLARSSRLFGTIEIGADLHQDPDGPRVFGPTLRLELPIFDQRQAMIARLEAQQRQSERRLLALSVNARSEVRVARAKLLAARQVAEHYRKVLLPLRQRIVELSQLHYNGMFIGPYQLLAAKQEQVHAYRGYIESLRDYWSARAELERVAGGRLPGSPPPPTPTSAGQDGAAKDGHDHDHTTK